jgi:hypothetical protein
VQPTIPALRPIQAAVVVIVEGATAEVIEGPHKNQLLMYRNKGF